MRKIFLLLTLLPFLFIACSDDDKPSGPSIIKIISVSPEIGPVGTNVVITGENFPTDAAQILLQFNEAVATIDSIQRVGQQVMIYTSVPEGASTGKIFLIINSTTYTSPNNFVVVSSNNSLLPLEVGNYWVYAKYQLDSNAVTIYDNPGRDSLFAASSEMVLGKQAMKLKSYSKLDLTSVYEETQDQFYYEEENVIYTHSSWFDELMNFGGAGIALPFDIEEQWLKLIDPNSTQWEIYQREFNNQQFSFGTITGTLVLTGYNLGSSNIQVAGVNYQNTLQVNLKFTFQGTAQTQFGSFPLDLERNMTIWYAPTIGRVKVKMIPMRLVLQGLVDTLIPGYELNLINSQLK